MPTGHTVLIVEDAEDVRSAFAAYLEGAGYSVVEAIDGADALRRLKATPADFCLILLDLYMPGMDGWTFRGAQLSDPRLAAIPVVVISAASRADDHATLLGAVAHMKKPVDLDALVSLVDTHC
jgi:two-component system chemotaxis response regulator CheY